MSVATATGNIVQGVLLEQSPGQIVLGLPGTDYRLHLLVQAPLSAEPGQRVTGRIFARAKRVDVMNSGGRFIEPVYGRPRRLQGRVLETDAAVNTITIQCAPGCAAICTLTTGQRADAIQVGQLVGFDVERGARFEVAGYPGAIAGQETPAEVSNPVPVGHSPTEGHQGMTDQTLPTPKSKDAGALGTDRDISGKDGPTGETPING